jgi:hypothetical protein
VVDACRRTKKKGGGGGREGGREEEESKKNKNAWKIKQRTKTKTGPKQDKKGQNTEIKTTKPRQTWHQKNKQNADSVFKKNITIGKCRGKDAVKTGSGGDFLVGAHALQQ